MPKVSVIIPTYNRAHLVGRAIRSVLNQTYHDFEIIVVDDGSTDNTEEVVKGFNDERMRYIRHKENKGGATARNTGIKAAKGEYIAFQDSDDEWLLKKLEKQMEVFKNASPEEGVVYAGFWRIKKGKKTYTPSSEITRKEGNIHKALLKGNFVTTQAAVVKKECFEKAGMFDERLRRLQDWELWIRISKYYNFKYINEPLVVSYYTSDSISANPEAFSRALQLIVEKHHKDIRKDRKLLMRHYFDIGTFLRLNGKMGQSRKYFIKTILAYPLNKVSLHAFFSLFGSKVYRRITKIKRLVIPINK